MCLLACAAPAHAADATRPHAHQGKLAPFARLPDAPALSEAERAQVAGGACVLRDMDARTDGRRMAVFVVDASPDVVWRTVSDFEAFPRYLDTIKSVEVLARAQRITTVRFTVSQLAFSMTYFVRHDYDDATRTGTWTLDYTKDSDLDDSIGFWRVTPYPAKDARGGERALVEYSAHVLLRTPLPGFILDRIRDGGLRDTCSWVRDHAARRARDVSRATPSR